MEKLKREIEQAEVVSFDIFDTLIVRLYRKPTDLFAHLEECEHVPGFQNARVAAEQSAREKAFQTGIHEITLEQIYDAMHPSYRALLQREIDLEKRMCKANPEMKAVFDFVLLQKKRIFISSDMYLPKEVIEDILARSGYQGYESLLLSSVTLRPKATGEMYEDLIMETCVLPCNILHIGDNYETDYQNAKKKGIQSYWYEPIQTVYGDNQNGAYFSILNQYAEKSVALSILKGMITYNSICEPDKDAWSLIGYKYAGLLMVGYCQWLKAQFDKEGITDIYFMLRDGYIVKRVFDQLYPNFKTHEIYGSRRMYLFARMERYEDIKSYVSSMTEGVTYKSLYERLLIDNPDLYRLYVKSFPDQNKPIKDLSNIHAFMKKYENYLLDVAKSERSVILEYLESIDLLGNKKCAVVDLGWRCSMLKGIQFVAEKSGVVCNLYGYYLGTHQFQTSGLRVSAFGINNGMPNDNRSIESVMNSAYIVDFLELIFTAPHPSVLKLRKEKGVFSPVYQSVTVHEQERIDISRTFLNSILQFADEYEKLTKGFPVSISASAALLSMYYFDRQVSKYDQLQVASVFVFPGVGDDPTCFPLVKNWRGSIGIINPWPGDISGESEAIIRIQRAVQDIGLRPICLDPLGHILDEDQRATGNLVESKHLDFVLTLQYETPKLLDSFYYHALWNPPEIPLNLDYYTQRVTNNYLMNDDYLVYDSGGMSNHLRSILLNRPRTLEGASSLTASFPISAILEPQLDEPTMFYCGMNWEATVHGTNRHEGLFKLLDGTKKVKFYGPETVQAWGGLKPWEGYQCYQYSIPFDGFSILKEINQCGICLVLSSDIHRRAGAATNRTYEACAAGAVIISDDNEFMLEHFKDAALFITYNKNNPKDTFRQIMEQYQWIVTHKEDALALAKRAQSIFTKQFALDIQIRNLIERHPLRFDQIRKDLFAKNSQKKVLVTYVLNSQYEPHISEYLDPVFANIQNQYYQNIELGIAVDRTLYASAKVYCETHCTNARVVCVELFDEKNAKKITDGEAIRQLQERIPHDYYINTNSKENWFYDHITTLIRSMEDQNTLCAYSGTIFEDNSRNRNIHFFDTLSTHYLFDGINDANLRLLPGQFLFHADAHNLFPGFLCSCLDGSEHYAYVNIIHYKHRQEISFSKRVTLCFKENGLDKRSIVLSDEMQLRFIQDLVRFDLPEQGKVVTAVPNGCPPSRGPESVWSMRKSIADAFMLMPIKNLIRLRYYRIKMRKLKPDSDKYRAYESKYTAVLKQYNEFWGL